MAHHIQSEIYRVITERVGSLEAFGSEREMQAFLVNNPAIVGCWDPSTKSQMPFLVKEEVFIKAGKDQKGRMDIVGVAKIDEKTHELRIFELKHGEIDSSAVNQLATYLSAWRQDDVPKNNLKRSILAHGLKGLTEQNIDELLDQPVGVLIGSKATPEAIRDALAAGISVIKLARFRGSTKSEHEYFVIVENLVGDIAGSARKSWSWQALIEKGLVAPSDSFRISYGADSLAMKPDPDHLSWNWIGVIFDDKSREILLERERIIRERAGKEKPKWLDKSLEAVKNRKGVWLSNATGLFYYAFGFPASYWVPTGYWIHEKTRKSLQELKEELF